MYYILQGGGGATDGSSYYNGKILKNNKGDKLTQMDTL
jgi:hypothetical protein